MTRRPRKSSKSCKKHTTFFRTKRNARFLTALDITTTISIRTRRSHPVHLPAAEVQLRDSTFQDLPGTPAPQAAAAAADRVFAISFQTCLAAAAVVPRE